MLLASSSTFLFNLSQSFAKITSLATSHVLSRLPVTSERLVIALRSVGLSGT